MKLSSIMVNIICVSSFPQAQRTARERDYLAELR